MDGSGSFGNQEIPTFLSESRVGMPSLTVENYVKAILQNELRSGERTISTGSLARALDVSPGTVTSMLKTLAEMELANYRPYEGVALTGSGRQVGMRMLRRHRLIEQFLVQTLELSWDQVHDEAENMEHAVSDFLIDRIDEFLGRPDHDPHGDPIPSPSGELRGISGDTIPLTRCDAGSVVECARVMNQDPEFLRFLGDAGLRPGVVAHIRQNDVVAGRVEVQVGTLCTELDRHAAEQLLVKPVGAGV